MQCERRTDGHDDEHALRRRRPRSEYPDARVRGSHRLTPSGSRINTVALMTAATSRAHPMNAFAGYQIAGDRVALTLKPYTPLGGTTRRMSGMLTIDKMTQDAINCARFR